MSAYPDPPTGAYICGGSYAEMSEDARRELHLYAEYLRGGGTKTHRTFRAWLDARPAAPTPETK